MSSYKKVGPSLYIKRAHGQVSSVSSSFKHYGAESNKDVKNTETPNPNVKDGGTLDRNFFTKTNFNYDNHLMNNDDNYLQSEYENDLPLERDTLERSEREAISKLESILY